MTFQPTIPDQTVKRSTSHFCPFLGIPGDATTHYQYPTRNNYCHVPDRPETIQFAHQQAFCLSDQYFECPVYSQIGVVKLPSDIRGTANAHNSPGTRVQAGTIIGALGLGVILIGTMIFLILQKGGTFPLSSSTVLQPSETPLILSLTPTSLPPTSTLAPSPVSAFVSITPTVTPSLTNTQTPTRTSAPPTFTPTYFPTPGPGFSTPFGPGLQFAIHIVQAGESYTAIGNQYNTTVEALDAVNKLKEGQTIWPGRLIVIPVGVTDPAGLPQFEVYLLPENTLLTELATQFNTDPEQIRFYNALGPEPEIPAGRWLIIPLLPEN